MLVLVSDSVSDSEWQADFEVVSSGLVLSCVVLMCQTKCGSLVGAVSGGGLEWSCAVLICQFVLCFDW